MFVPARFKIREPSAVEGPDRQFDSVESANPSSTIHIATGVEKTSGHVMPFCLMNTSWGTWSISRWSNHSLASHVMQPHIAIFHVNTVPSATFSEFRSSLMREQLIVEVAEREPDGPFAGVEWLMPTFVIGFIASAYFGGFLQEMGKDHYISLKEQFRRLYKPLAGPDAPEVELIGTKGKIKSEQPFSLYFSLVGEGPDGLRFKLLLRRPTSEEEYSASVDAFLDFLRDINHCGLSPEFRQLLETAKPVGKTMLVVRSSNTGRVVPVNPRTGEIVE